MNTLVVDDRQLAINAVERIVRALDAQGTCVGVRSVDDALETVRKYQVDVAFLDIEMPKMSGIEVAQRMKEAQPSINIVFVTAFEDYAMEAHRLYASGYLLKPVREEDVARALENLRNPVQLPSRRVLEVRCFGNFDAFANGKPVRFKRSKTKELLAYLIDRRGSRCTIGELMAVLWEDGVRTPSRRTQVRNLISDLRTALCAEKAEDIIVRGRDEIAVVPDKIDCDYYRFLQGDPMAVNQYRGEYMAQYSWAEMTAGSLQRRRE